MLIPSDIENMVPKSVPIQINSNRLNTKAKSSSSSQSSNFSQTARSTSVHHEHKPEFLDLLESIAPKNKEETKDIHDLWKELPGIERDLIDDRSPINLTRYKNQVNSLLKAILLTNNSIKTQYTPIKLVYVLPLNLLTPPLKVPIQIFPFLSAKTSATWLSVSPFLLVK